jgi:hypothetical protein
MNVSVSRALRSGCPTSCAACGEPFKIDKGGYVQAWRFGDEHICEACAAGAELRLGLTKHIQAPKNARLPKFSNRR